MRATGGTRKPEEFWELTRREWADYVCPWLLDRWESRARDANMIRHLHATGMSDRVPSFGQLMGVAGTRFDPGYISEEEYDRFPETARPIKTD